jgi:hypothetical protein
LPRRFWEGGEKPRPNESNEGLLKIDLDREIALFEAEHHRFSIPAVSILSAQIENWQGVSPAVEGLYAVVLRVRVATGVRELPLFPLGNLPVTGNWDRATYLLGIFEELCDRTLGDQPTEPPPPIEVAVPG